MPGKGQGVPARGLRVLFVEAHMPKRWTGFSVLGRCLHGVSN